MLTIAVKTSQCEKEENQNWQTSYFALIKTSVRLSFSVEIHATTGVGLKYLHRYTIHNSAISYHVALKPWLISRPSSMLCT